MSQTVEKVRSKEDEEALDRKIAEIRKKNEQIARRKEEVDKDRELFVAEVGESLNSSPKQPEKDEKAAKDTKESKNGNGKANEWDREWDAGKTSADTWKENVPEMGHSLRGMKHHSLWRSQQRGGISRGRGMRTRITPRSEFTLHDDRAEPTKPKKSDRDRKQRITSPSANSPADASQTKPPAKNDTVVAQKTKPSEKEKKATQGATSTTTRPPVSDKAAAHGDKSQKPQTGPTADRKKPLAIRIAPANKDEMKGTKKDANEERPVKDARGPTGERRRPVGERSDRVVGTRGRGLGAPTTGTAGRLARGGAAGGIERAGATTTRTTPTRTAASAKPAGSGPVKRTPLQSNRRKAVSPNKQVSNSTNNETTNNNKNKTAENTTKGDDSSKQPRRSPRRTAVKQDNRNGKLSNKENEMVIKHLLEDIVKQIA